MATSINLIGIVEASIDSAVTRAVAEARTSGVGVVPYDTGALSESITTTKTRSGDQLTYTITANSPYAKFLQDGTGLFGPHSQRIKPKNGNFLAFDGIVVRSTAGFGYHKGWWTKFGAVVVDSIKL